MIIDKDGLAEIQTKVGNPLRSMFDKLEKTGDFNRVSDEFDFIFKFLGEIENWDEPNVKNPAPKNVTIDGKLYTPQIGG